MPKARPEQIQPDGAVSGQVLTFNGTDWAPADSAGGIFGSEFESSRDQAQYDTTSDQYQLASTHTTASLPAGDYLVTCSFLGFTSGDHKEARGRIDVDDVQETELGYQHIVRETMDYTTVKTLGAGVHTFKVYHRTVDPSMTSSITDIRVVLWRVA